MRTRAILAACLVLAALGGLARPAAAAPTCGGKAATHVMRPGDPPYFGTPGADVVVGWAGDDTIDLGFDSGELACGRGGNDTIAVFGPGSLADGEAGSDDVYAQGIGSVARGGPGADAFVGADNEARAEGGSGDDVLVSAGSGGVSDGGSGSDRVVADSGAVGISGSGNDRVEARLGVGQPGDPAAAIEGGSGSDVLINVGGTPGVRIDCGSAYDRVAANGATSVSRCEATFTP